MNLIKSLHNNLGEGSFLMPVFFIGHGSPMNGIENNEYSRSWQKTAKEIPQPKAVIVISAHWCTRGTLITAMDFPKTIHDFGGFPKELYEIQYPAPGDPALAKQTSDLLHNANAKLDHEWGLDHGTWSIVRHMYPEANIPVLQISLDYNKDAAYHYALAKELFELRKKGVLIIGSGNMVHNLGLIDWKRLDENDYGYEWTKEINNTFKKLITNGNHKELINYLFLGKEASLAIPTPEHYLPLLYTLALQQKNETIEFFNDKAVGGSITMTSIKIL